MEPPFVVVEGSGPVIATAIHDGHAMRTECSSLGCLDDATRLREEDPYTGRVAQVVPTHLIATRSRFEVDLNRPRDSAIYVRAEDAWGLTVWSSPPSTEVIARSLAVYDAFYTRLRELIAARVARYGRVCVLDIHSYNHRRGEDRAPGSAQENPEINVGTGTVDRSRWGSLVERFCSDLVYAGPFDVRENVKFKGGELSKWVHRTFPTSAVCLAIELKKTFMDEWTGIADDAHIAKIAKGVEGTLPGIATELAR